MSTKKTVSIASAFAVIMLAGCSAGPAAVSFKSDVKPLIDKYCTECHTKGGAGDEASGFVTETYDTVMKGTKFGPVVVAGDPLSSSLYRLVAGKVDPSIRMPHGKEALSQEEISKIELWIEQGAKHN
ncbi:MAG: hypothetical protein KZQ93_10570 [Candidatus Thiodiazotropha sp. (ex Monitilora ramsayi)]|nr:hypothetical protein [Candidatus Thiodiazotropha sp. (ex Monitilora ramsayi)]